MQTVWQVDCGLQISNSDESSTKNYSSCGVSEKTTNWCKIQQKEACLSLRSRSDKCDFKQASWQQESEWKLPRFWLGSKEIKCRRYWSVSTKCTDSRDVYLDDDQCHVIEPSQWQQKLKE